LHHAQFLQEVRPVAIQPFGFGLRANGPIPLLVVLGTVDVHTTIIAPRALPGCQTLFTRPKFTR
ncbi:MAG: hypothetical protein QOD97_306, partial [Mycobacterium sp.]|nr:hypothetical protein [Mycobacterium sp.]